MSYSEVLGVLSLKEHVTEEEGILEYFGDHLECPIIKQYVLTRPLFS